MTPKQKAVDLFRRFVIKHNRWSENEYTLSKTIPELKKELFNTQWFAPKEMSLMCVEEILKAREAGTTGVIFDKEYWEEVREEIERL